MDSKSPRYFDTQQAVSYLAEKGVSLAATTLATLASRGGGPRFHKDGHRRVYTDRDLDAFATTRLGSSVASTSEISANAA